MRSHTVATADAVWRSPPIGEAVRIYETWSVVQNWWTEDPSVVHYRKVLLNGHFLIQRRESYDDPWVEWEIDTLSPPPF